MTSDPSLEIFFSKTVFTMACQVSFSSMLAKRIWRSYDWRGRKIAINHISCHHIALARPPKSASTANPTQVSSKPTKFVLETFYMILSFPSQVMTFEQKKYFNFLPCFHLRKKQKEVTICQWQSLIIQNGTFYHFPSFPPKTGQPWQTYGIETG